MTYFAFVFHPTPRHGLGMVFPVAQVQVLYISGGRIRLSALSGIWNHSDQSRGFSYVYLQKSFAGEGKAPGQHGNLGAPPTSVVCWEVSKEEGVDRYTLTSLVLDHFRVVESTGFRAFTLKRNISRVFD